MQSCSTMLMERIMMKMVAVICCLDWIKLDRLTVVWILHIMLVVVVFLSMIFHTYSL